MPKLLTFWVLASLFCLSATCRGPKEEPEKETAPSYMVQFELSILYPHCGGAPPRSEPMPVPLDQVQFYIKEGTTNSAAKAVRANFTTDDQGLASIQLPKGTYCLIKAYKNQSFEEFYQQKHKKPGPYYSLKDKACFEAWYAQCDLQVEVTEAGVTVIHTFYSQCFTADHPCMEYEGAMPP